MVKSFLPGAEHKHCPNCYCVSHPTALARFIRHCCLLTWACPAPHSMSVTRLPTWACPAPHSMSVTRLPRTARSGAPTARRRIPLLLGCMSVSSIAPKLANL